MTVNGSTAARGYGWRHQQTRKQLAPYVDAGLVDCWRCGEPIQPGTPWHLGHDDHDRTIVRGPEHVDCNTAAGARKTNALRRRTPRRRRSRVW